MEVRNQVCAGRREETIPLIQVGNMHLVHRWFRIFVFFFTLNNFRPVSSGSSFSGFFMMMMMTMMMIPQKLSTLRCSQRVRECKKQIIYNTAVAFLFAWGHLDPPGHGGKHRQAVHLSQAQVRGLKSLSRANGLVKI